MEIAIVMNENEDCEIETLDYVEGNAFIKVINII